MYTGGGIPGQFRGPIPTNKAIPSGPPGAEPPPPPPEEEETPTSSPPSRSTAKTKKSLRQSMANFSGIKKVKSSSSPNVKRNEESLLAVATKTNEEAQKKLEDGPPPKLTHATAGRPMRGRVQRPASRPGRPGAAVGGRPAGAGRRPPSRKPMSARATPLQTTPSSPDVSLVAQKKPPPENLSVAGARPARPTAPKSIANLVDEKAKETEAIEREKKKSAMQKVGSKTVMRIFLDNNGTGFKTVPVPFPCNMYSLVEIMRKKVFTDTVGYGIYEVRDGKDVRLIDPEEEVADVMSSWNQDALFKFVFKKALGKYSDLYLNGPPKDEPEEPPQPTKSAVPVKPQMPSKPDTPAKPDMPAKPEMPAKPDPEEPAKPDKPSMPSKPTMPSMPSKPTMPSMPSKPDKPQMPSKPSMPSMPAKPSLNSDLDRASSVPAKLGGDDKPRPSSASYRRPPPGGRRPPPRLSGSNQGSPATMPARPSKPGSHIGGGGIRNSTGNIPPQRRQPPKLSTGPPSTPPPKPVVQETPPAASAPAPAPSTPTPQPAAAMPAKPEPEAPPVAAPTPAAQPAVVVPAEPTPVASSGPSYKSKPIEEWSVEEVGDWISDLGFEKMRQCFVDNYISGLELIELNNSELKEDLGVAALGARKAILREIGNLKS